MHRTIQSADIIVICLDFYEWCPYAQNTSIKENDVEKIYRNICKRSQDLLSYIKANSKTKIIWFGFEDYNTQSATIFGTKYETFGLVDKVNLSINEYLSDDIYIDFKKIIALCGIRNSYNRKGKYRWNAPYSKELIKIMANEVHKQYLINSSQSKKCIILDCDNVLWGGILSEDGIENLKLARSGLGRLYQDFQRFALLLYYHGVILAVCSKNDLSEVLAMFRGHSEMILKEEHIACFQVNWESKIENIKAIAEKLNIGLESMVFVDDSPIEIEMVNTFLPELTTILFNRDLDYDQFSCFNLKSDVNYDSIEKRNNTYRTNIQRDALKKRCNNYEKYIKTLDVKTEIHKMISMEYSRVSELTQRTNKCTNGKRFTTQEIRTCVENGELDFYTVHVSDRFSDLGLVGAFAVKNSELVLLCLSCRALGLKIENIILDFINSNWKIKDVFFNSTGKNLELKELIQKKIHPIFFE